MPDEYAYETMKILKAGGLGGISEQSETDASLNAIKILLSHLVQDNGVRKSLGEQVLDVTQDMFTGGTDQVFINRYGLAVEDNHLFIAGDHPQTKEIFSRYGITGHYGLISLFKTAKQVDSMAFGAIRSKAVKIPIPEIM
jgi:hypothetical protein